ncbi:MAG: hypothetical protein ABI612_07370 [Betaproteobacteria bacterium]
MRNYNLSRPLPQGQRGVILVIALIVLVAMTLVAIGTLRSVDTSSVVAGNLAFKQSTLGGTDVAVETAYQWLMSNATGATLQSDHPAEGYYSSQGAEPDWSAESSWTGALCMNSCAADADGNAAWYIIQRMCTQPNQAYNSATNSCAQSEGGGAGGLSNNSAGYAANKFTGASSLYYRVTARVTGPRNSVSVVQAIIAI